MIEPTTFINYFQPTFYDVKTKGTALTKRELQFVFLRYNQESNRVYKNWNCKKYKTLALYSLRKVNISTVY